MRVSRGVSLVVALAVAPAVVSPVAAQDAETLRRELEVVGVFNGDNESRSRCRSRAG